MADIEIADAEEVDEGNIELPDEPGVYAWYRKLAIDPTSVSDFEDSVNEVVERGWKTALQGSGTVGRRYTAEIAILPSKKQLTESKSDIAQTVARSTRSRYKFAVLAEIASLFQPPLYTGKGNDLQDRVSEHLDQRTGFSKRASKAGIDLTDCVIAYLTMPAQPPRTNELLEYIVDVVSIPRYGKQSG